MVNVKPVLFALAVFLVGVLLHGWGAIYDDAAADRVIVEAAWTGVDPYQPIPKLYREMGFEEGLYPGVASRTPAAFIVQAPALVVPVAYAGLLNIALAAVSLTAICGMSGRFSWWWLAALASFPVLLSLYFANIVFFYMALIVWALRGDTTGRGIALGVVAAVRLWPALIILALWMEGRRKLAAVAAMTAVGLNAAGLFLVPLPNVIDGLRRANDFWTLDASLPGPGWLWPVVAIVIVLIVRRVDVSVPLAIIASPISWPTYYLAALPQIVARRAWIPAVMIGWLSWWSPWFAAAGGIWLAATIQTQKTKRQLAHSGM